MNRRDISEQAAERLKNYCFQESITMSERQAVLDAMRSWDFSQLSNPQLFLGFDALGTCRQRDPKTEALYQVFANLWRLSSEGADNLEAQDHSQP